MEPTALLATTSWPCKDPETLAAGQADVLFSSAAGAIGRGSPTRSCWLAVPGQVSLLLPSVTHATMARTRQTARKGGPVVVSVGMDCRVARSFTTMRPILAPTDSRAPHVAAAFSRVILRRVIFPLFRHSPPPQMPLRPTPLPQLSPRALIRLGTMLKLAVKPPSVCSWFSSAPLTRL